MPQERTGPKVKHTWDRLVLISGSWGNAFPVRSGGIVGPTCTGSSVRTLGPFASLSCYVVLFHGRDHMI